MRYLIVKFLFDSYAYWCKLFLVRLSDIISLMGILLFISALYHNIIHYIHGLETHVLLLHHIHYVVSLLGVFQILIRSSTCFLYSKVHLEIPVFTCSIPFINTLKETSLSVNKPHNLVCAKLIGG